MNKTNELGKSKEDYLEAILVIQKEKGICFSIDIANKLNFSKPSVSNAVKKLEADLYITRDHNGIIYFTEKGLKIAEETFDRHLTLKSLFEMLGVNEEIAENDACLIEHHLSKETYLALKNHFNQIKK